MLQDNIKDVNERIAKACALCGRRAEDIKIVAVTKFRDAQTVNQLPQYGICTIGENRVQELLSKYDELSDNFDIQIIGQLQTNKVKYIVDKVSTIQSVDRLDLAHEIDKRCAPLGKIMNVLLEVNIAEIPGRGGVIPDNDAVYRLCDDIVMLHNVKLCGVMAVAPVCEKQEDARPYMSKVHTLFCNLQQRYNGISRLSMGMSADFEQAIYEGATEIRLGSALFGARKYN